MFKKQINIKGNITSDDLDVELQADLQHLMKKCNHTRYGP